MKLPYCDHKPGTPEHNAFVHAVMDGASASDYETDRGRVGAPSIGRKADRGSTGWSAAAPLARFIVTREWLDQIEEAWSGFARQLKVTADAAKSFVDRAMCQFETYDDVDVGPPVDPRKAARLRQHEFKAEQLRRQWRRQR